MVIENKEFYTKEEVQNLINKSISKSKKRSKANWEKGIKAGAIIGVSATLLLSIPTTLFVSNAIDNVKNEEAYRDHASEIVAMVDENKQFNYHFDRDNPSVYYDTDKIAKSLLEEDGNFDLNFFKVYNTVKGTSSFTDSEIRTTMNSVLDWVNSFSKASGNEESVIYPDFENYVKNLGFVDKDGNADYKKYSEALKDIIVKLEQAENAVLEYGIEYEGFGGRK